ALSRASRKDLARDYGAAAIERSAARLAPLREQARQLRTDEQTLRSARAAVEHAAVATRHVAERQADLEHAAARVYVNPAQAARAIAADPHAAERLDAATRWAAHQSRGSSARVHELAAAYGQPRGQLRTFRGPDAERMEALNSLSGLQRAARSFGEATRTAADAHERVASWTEVLGKAGVALSDLPRALQRVAAALQRVQHAMKGPEQALETAVRSMGHSAARAAVGMLPPALHAPAQLALHAVEKALDLGLGLGR
ncbi:MAG TPA: hypothetical protein VHR45_11310, partial [Thermoanaerobaculia bacterium]|nr:hypothetical protein [Thermoanaerobaculia bacterium]